MSKAERQQRARDVTRRAILDAALELFVADGYAQVSLRKIAAKVDYSPAAIYRYFPSKDEIFFALAEEGFRLLGAPRLNESPNANPLDDIRATAWGLYEFSRRQPQYFALVFLDRRVPRIGKEYERFAFLSEIRDRLRALMQRCIDEGQVPSSLDATAALRLVLAPVFGIVVLRLSGRLGPSEDPDVLARAAIDTMIAGLMAGGAARVMSSPREETGTPDLAEPHQPPPVEAHVPLLAT
jgi:AcrR family transcriptional regulator